jgi:DNA-binding transcriptional LysR family regulator
LSKIDLRRLQDQDSLDLPLRQVRYFVTVAEELHFGRAARRLHMAQPPLSQAIRRLEAQLGVTLLDRQPRHVALTDAGRLFLAECHTLLAQARRATDTARSARPGASSVLHLGCVSSALYDLLPAVLPRFRAAFPEVQLTITETDTAPALEQLRRGLLDVALIRRAYPTAGLDAEPLREDVLAVALPSDHPLVRRREVALKDLAAEPWVFVSRVVSPDYHDVFIAACRRARFSPVLRHAARSIEAQVGVVACGLGVALVPESAERLKLPGVEYRPVRPRTSLVELAAVFSAGRERDEVLDALLGMLRAFEPAATRLRRTGGG